MTVMKVSKCQIPRCLTPILCLLISVGVSNSPPISLVNIKFSPYIYLLSITKYHQTKVIFYVFLEPESQFKRPFTNPEPLDTFSGFVSKFFNSKNFNKRLRSTSRANLFKKACISHSYRKKMNQIRRVPATSITFAKSRVRVLTLFLV